MTLFHVVLSRKTYDATLPWNKEAMALAAKKVRRVDRLEGFRYEFAKLATAEAFCAAIGVAPFDCLFAH